MPHHATWPGELFHRCQRGEGLLLEEAASPGAPSEEPSCKIHWLPVFCSESWGSGGFTSAPSSTPPEGLCAASTRPSWPILCMCNEELTPASHASGQTCMHNLPSHFHACHPQHYCNSTYCPSSPGERDPPRKDPPRARLEAAAGGLGAWDNAGSRVDGAMAPV